MAKMVKGEVRAEPNMTPLLDVVFQLITFFMLVFRISTESYDQRVKLPVAGSSRPVEGSAAGQDHLILNIDSAGSLLWGGQVLGTDRAIRELDIQARLIRLNLKVAGKEPGPGEPLPTVIVLRADRRARFEQVFQLITACQGLGFTKFALKAMNAEE
jgi:biopolymer transport protein ExbD